MTDSAQHLVHDGSIVAIGGVGLNRKPMSLIRDIADAGLEGLTVVAFLGSLDVELLIATGAAEVVHTAGTGLNGMGLAPRFRSSRQTGSTRVIEWSEGSLAASLEAAALGLDSMPCGTSPRSEIVDVNPHLRALPDPFTGVTTTYAEATTPDVGLIQASAVDSRGNVHIDGDPAVDVLVARASRRTVVSVLVEEDRDPRAAALSRVWVDEVVIDPDGCWPTACHPGPTVDLRGVQAWSAAKGSDPSILYPGGDR